MADVKSAIPIIKFLEENKEDRAVMAHLRRGLGKPPGTVVEMFPYVSRYFEGKGPADDAKFIISSLFAWHQQSTDKGNMGDHFRKISNAFGQENESAERRFRALLNAHFDSLHYHLRQAVGLAKSKDVPINWSQLYRDIINWSRPERFVQKNWAKAFWAPEKQVETVKNKDKEN